MEFQVFLNPHYKSLNQFLFSLRTHFVQIQKAEKEKRRGEKEFFSYYFWKVKILKINEARKIPIKKKRKKTKFPVKN